MRFNRLSYGSGATVDNNGIGAILGGGMDIPFTKKFAWRLFQADYVFARHNYAGYADANFPNLRRVSLEGVRLRTGIVFSWGGAEGVPPAAACTVQPTEVMVGEPITATVTASNFNPKHTVTYSWSGNGGGQVTGKDTGASIDTNNVAPGNYTVTAHVTDPKVKKGERSQLLGELHGEAAAAEESADNVRLGQPIGAGSGRNREPVGATAPVLTACRSRLPTGPRLPERFPATAPPPL